MNRSTFKNNPAQWPEGHRVHSVCRSMISRRDAVRLLAAGAATGLGSGLVVPHRLRAQQAKRRSTKTVPIRRPEATARAESGSKNNDAGRPAHPLDAPLEQMLSCRETMAKVRDYTSTFIRREEIEGELTNHEYMYMKCRNHPLSVYLYFLKPHSGREVIYVDGWYDGRLVVHETGVKDAVAGTLFLLPTDEKVLKESRYPITQAGIANLIEQIIAGWQKERQYGESDVKYYKGAKVVERSCNCIELVHPYPRRQFLYHQVRVFIDEELNLPIRFEAYRWPRRQGQTPPLVEEYTYTKLRLNPGLSDRDFDVRNPQYSFS